jgi:hypothetical protein
MPGVEGTEPRGLCCQPVNRICIHTTLQMQMQKVQMQKVQMQKVQSRGVCG